MQKNALAAAPHPDGGGAYSAPADLVGRRLAPTLGISDLACPRPSYKPPKQKSWLYTGLMWEGVDRLMSHDSCVIAYMMCWIQWLDDLGTYEISNSLRWHA